MANNYRIRKITPEDLQDAYAFQDYINKIIERRMNRMEVNIKLTKEETNTINKVIDELRTINCSAIYCWVCPFRIAENNGCIKDRLTTIVRKYGYKVSDNE